MPRCVVQRLQDIGADTVAPPVRLQTLALVSAIAPADAARESRLQYVAPERSREKVEELEAPPAAAIPSFKSRLARTRA